MLIYLSSGEDFMATAVTEQERQWLEDRTKPPFLRRVRIRGYKSIAFCDVELQPLTVLVGRNGSGKSNFLDALAFLRDALRFSVPEAVKRHGEFPAILCRSVASAAVSIEIEAAFANEAGAYVAHYGLTIPANHGSQAVCPHEVFRFEDITRQRTWRFDARQGKAEWSDGRSVLFASEYLYLGVLGERPFHDLADGLRYMGMYNCHPEAIRGPQMPSIGYQLERDGSNLAGAIAMLREKDPGRLETVKEYLRLISPDVQDFDRVAYGDYETIRFRVHVAPESPPLELNAASISDGTLRALAALMAAFQVVFPANRPSVIGIEEPETSLHPAAAHALASALEGATEHTQVLLTTHSGDLLAERYIQPPQVLVVRNRNGTTQIAPVDAASREIIRKELYTLADLQRMDQLDLDEADLARQAQVQKHNGEA
jgi:predicted ATPase